MFVDISSDYWADFDFFPSPNDAESLSYALTPNQSDWASRTDG